MMSLQTKNSQIPTLYSSDKFIINIEFDVNAFQSSVSCTRYKAEIFFRCYRTTVILKFAESKVDRHIKNLFDLSTTSSIPIMCN